VGKKSGVENMGVCIRKKDLRREKGVLSLTVGGRRGEGKGG